MAQTPEQVQIQSLFNQLSLLQKAFENVSQRLADLEFKVNTHISYPPYAPGPYSPSYAIPVGPPYYTVPGYPHYVTPTVGSPQVTNV